MTGEQGTLCTRCGASVAAGAYFCARCGTSIPIGSGDAGATVASASHALLDALRQATLGAYEVLAEVGHGGMATVYLAHDLALDRKVAIKVLEPALLLMGEGMAERFKREARTAAALSHPHIIPIYAVKEGEHVLYFVMKYVQGRPLDSVIRDVGPLPIPMVQAIVAQVGDALGHGAPPRRSGHPRRGRHADVGEGSAPALAQHGRPRGRVRPAVLAARRARAERDGHARKGRCWCARIGPDQDADEPDCAGEVSDAPLRGCGPARSLGPVAVVEARGGRDRGCPLGGAPP